ncbi:PREDICTED: uncharacterized protein LOC104815446 [Tarenaya hassleriana]|uniref:uncharacterized protein LOC104815446 n=1 Tax=Tarenaya hassleriana TaxID=28532 RepID=UPI00053C6B37|nr:PREDICTED: uncharacterized protein LOC104815446 [Tarenaya hassleriana]
MRRKSRKRRRGRRRRISWRDTSDGGIQEKGDVQHIVLLQTTVCRSCWRRRRIGSPYYISPIVGKILPPKMINHDPFRKASDEDLKNLHRCKTRHQDFSFTTFNVRFPDFIEDIMTRSLSCRLIIWTASWQCIGRC